MLEARHNLNKIGYQANRSDSIFDFLGRAFLKCIDSWISVLCSLYSLHICSWSMLLEGVFCGQACKRRRENYHHTKLEATWIFQELSAVTHGLACSARSMHVVLFCQLAPVGLPPPHGSGVRLCNWEGKMVFWLVWCNCWYNIQASKNNWFLEGTVQFFQSLLQWWCSLQHSLNISFSDRRKAADLGPLYQAVAWDWPVDVTCSQEDSGL